MPFLISYNFPIKLDLFSHQITVLTFSPCIVMFSMNSFYYYKNLFRQIRSEIHIHFKLQICIYIKNVIIPKGYNAVSANLLTKTAVNRIQAVSGTIANVWCTLLCDRFSVCPHLIHSIRRMFIWTHFANEPFEPDVFGTLSTLNGLQNYH